MKVKSRLEQQDIERLQDALAVAGLRHVQVTSAQRKNKHVLVRGDYADILLARKELSGWRVDRDLS